MLSGDVQIHVIPNHVMTTEHVSQEARETCFQEIVNVFTPEWDKIDYVSSLLCLTVSGSLS